MSRFLTVAVFSFLASFSAATAFAGEFIDEGLLSADVIDREDSGSGEMFDAILDYRDASDAAMDSTLAMRDRAERERDMRDCRRRGDCNRRRPSPPPRRPSPRPGYGYICYAENEYREIFTGYNRTNARVAQIEAIDNCEPVSRRCVARGCERY